MCASCVAQGVTYVGGAVVALRVMARRAAARPQEPDEVAPVGDDAGLLGDPSGAA